MAQDGESSDDETMFIGAYHGSRKLRDLWWDDDGLHLVYDDDGSHVLFEGAWVESVASHMEGPGVTVQKMEYVHHGRK